MDWEFVASMIGLLVFGAAYYAARRDIRRNGVSHKDLHPSGARITSGAFAPMVIGTNSKAK